MTVTLRWDAIRPDRAGGSMDLGQNGSGQNGTDKMVWTKLYTDKMALDKMAWTKWYNFIFCVHLNSVEFDKYLVTKSYK